MGTAAGRLLVLSCALVGLAPTAALAWPAVQDLSGFVHLCESRPTQVPDGAWSCRSAGGLRTGALIEVVRPGTPPGVRPWDTRGVPPGRYVPYPWGPPPREPSGYDALDPGLGPGAGGADR